MTKRERVLKALRFEDTDIVPYHISLTGPARQKFIEHVGEGDLEEILGNHLYGVSGKGINGMKEERPGFFRDTFGVLWDRTVDTDIGNPCEMPLAEGRLDDCRWPDPTDPRRFEGMDESIERGKDRLLVSGLGFSLFERAWTLRGMQNLLMDMVTDEDFVHKLMDAICDWNMAYVGKLLEHPIDAVYFGDDWGQQQGLIMGPVLWRKFIKPRIARMYRQVRDAGRMVYIHSCGKVDELFDELVEIGLNIFNPFQPEVMDTVALAKKYKGRLAFCGGISVQRLLPYGTPDEVRSEVGRICREIGAGGGYIAGPSHSIPKDVPAENIVALWETLKGQA